MITEIKIHRYSHMYYCHTSEFAQRTCTLKPDNSESEP